MAVSSSSAPKLNKAFVASAENLIDMHYDIIIESDDYYNDDFQFSYDDVKQLLEKSNNPIKLLLSWYNDIYNMYNYNSDADKSPFYDLLTPIEDPLISILKRIAEKEGYKNIDKIF